MAEKNDLTALRSREPRVRHQNCKQARGVAKAEGNARTWSLLTEILPHENASALLSCLSFLVAEFCCLQP